MYILLTDPFSRKTFDIANILKKRKYKLLIAYDGNIIIKLIVVLLYTSKAFRLNANRFNNDLNKLESSIKNEIVFFPIEEQTILYFYNYINNNINSKIRNLLPDENIFNTVRDKVAFSSFCLANSVNVPIEYKHDELLKMNELPSPLIIKPKHGSGSVGIHYIDNISELDNAKIIDFSKYLIQERIEDGQNILGGFFLAHKGELIIYYGHKRIRTYPEEGGVTVYSKVDFNDEIKHLGVDLLKKLNWSGIAMIEFLYDKRSNSYKIIELNPRAWGSIMLSEFCNSNMLSNYINIALNREIEKSFLKDNVYIRWIFPWDVISYIKKKGEIKNFWSLNLKNTCYINFTYSNFFQSFFFLLLNIFDFNKLKKLYTKISKK